MPVLPRSAPKEEKRERAADEMRKFYRGELRSGSRSGPRVTSPAQAKAIAMSVSGQSKPGRDSKRNARKGGRVNGRR